MFDADVNYAHRCVGNKNNPFNVPHIVNTLMTTTLKTCSSFIVLALCGCSVCNQQTGELPPEQCGYNLECQLTHGVDKLKSITFEIDCWSNWNTYAIFASIVLGAIATLMIALQGDSNKVWTRPIGIIATTFGAAITTMLSSFHVQDNIDKLIEIRSKLGSLINNLEHDTKGKSPDDAYEKMFTYSNEFGKLMAERTKLRGSAGRLNIGASPEISKPAATPAATEASPPK